LFTQEKVSVTLLEENTSVGSPHYYSQPLSIPRKGGERW